MSDTGEGSAATRGLGAEEPIPAEAQEALNALAAREGGDVYVVGGGLYARSPAGVWTWEVMGEQATGPLFGVAASR